MCCAHRSSSHAGPCHAGFGQHPGMQLPYGTPGRGLHSSTFQLNLSTFCAVDLVFSVAKTAQVELSSGRV